MQPLSSEQPDIAHSSLHNVDDNGDEGGDDDDNENDDATGVL